MTTKDEALALALEALNNITNVFLDTEGNFGWRENDAIDKAYQTITAIKQAQEQESEPVAWVWNPAKESWEQVRAYGHWQQGAIYAFGPNPPAPKQAEPQIHCPEKLKKGGCQLHNLHCGWPKCNALPTPPEAT